jgi:phosphoesterase RecJ-like protein
MVYRLYEIMHINIDNIAAEAIYAGILTDTGSFRYINTTSFTHRVVAELLRFNLNVAQIYRNIYESIPFSDISLLPRVLLTIERYASGKIITFKIRKKLVKKAKLYSFLSENVLSFGRSILGSEVCVLFKEQQDKTGNIRVNLRSQGKVDVNRVAQFFGGGGHKTASGCTIKGNLENVKKRVLRKIREQLK